MPPPPKMSLVFFWQGDASQSLTEPHSPDMSHRPTVGSVAKTTTEHPVVEFSGTADTENVDSTCNVDCAYAVDLVNAAGSESVPKPNASPSAIADTIGLVVHHRHQLYICGAHDHDDLPSSMNCPTSKKSLKNALLTGLPSTMEYRDPELYSGQVDSY